MGTSEFGTCPSCGKVGDIQRTYFHYDIKCECHSPNHVEIVWRCKDCHPVEPEKTRIFIKTENLKRALSGHKNDM